jgi:hypothetical protein
MKRILSIGLLIVVGVLYFHSCLNAQVLSPADGELTVLYGFRYKLEANPDTLLPIYPVVGDGGWGYPANFVLEAPAGSTWEIQLTLPESLVANPHQAMPCSFDSMSLFRYSSQQYLNPHLKQTITVGPSGFEDFYLGIIVDLTSIQVASTFDGDVRIRAVNTTSEDTLEEVFSFIVNSECYNQASDSHDGELVRLSRGRTYTLLTNAGKTLGVISPIINGHERGLPLILVLAGQAEAFVELKVSVPQFLRNNERTDSLHCSFDKLVRWMETEEILSVNKPDTVRLDSCGKATVVVGISVDIPEDAAVGDYWNAILFQASYIGFYQETKRTLSKKGNISVQEAYIYSVEVDDFPEKFSLYQNFPNPFNPETKIRYELPRQDYVSLKIYSLLGEEVATLVNAVQPAGVYEVIWNAGSFSSGMYEYRIQTSSFVTTKKLIVTK